jgi:hypothetical protein
VFLDDESDEETYVEQVARVDNIDLDQPGAVGPRLSEVEKEVDLVARPDSQQGQEVVLVLKRAALRFGHTSTWISRQPESPSLSVLSGLPEGRKRTSALRPFVSDG